MPSHLLLRVAWQVHDDDPKNQFVINPTFRRQMDLTDPTSGTDAQALCDDLANAIAGWQYAPTKAVKVTAYNLEGAKPNYPMASKSLNPTAYWAPAIPSQLALCLSFYGTVNQPRKRGRLYVPVAMATDSSGSIAALQADSTLRSKIAALVPIFSNLGGSNVDWIVWSRVNQSAAKVTNYFVDESWDIIRSRKIKGTVRTTGTTSG